MALRIKRKYALCILLSFIASACKKVDNILPGQDAPSPPVIGTDIVTLPVVVHVIHNGEEMLRVF